MNKLLIGALAGLSDLTQLADSVKTKADAEFGNYGFGYNYKNKGGGSKMNFLSKPPYQNQRFNNLFSPNSTQTTLAWNLPATSAITAIPSNDPNTPYYGNPYFCKNRHEVQIG